MRLESMLDLARILGEQGDYNEALRLVVERASSLVRAEATLIMMINPRTRNTIKTIYAERESGDEHARFVHTNLSGWVIVNSRALLSQDIKADDRFRKRLFEEAEARSAICVPFKVGNTIMGTLLLLNSERRPPFTEDDLSVVEDLAAIASPFLHSAQTIAQYFSSPLPKQALLRKYAALGLLGRSKPFLEMLHSIDAASRCDVRVLLEGESGTGKELVARAVHKLSARGHKKLVAIDCGAIQPNLVESELFGHIKGAFTGALTDRRGLFEEADGGTLFMDEVNNLPVEMQAKLLRVLQDEEIRPVGSNLTRKVNVRIVTASSMSLVSLVSEKKFREDLFYRLNVYPIAVPSLARRGEDVPLLAEHFLAQASHRQGKEIEGFDEEVVDFMRRRRWAGNVRELENFVERMVTLAENEQKLIDRSVLPPEVQKELKRAKKTPGSAPVQISLRKSLADHEAQLIGETLEACKWNQSLAARMLKVSEPTLRYKMRRLKISAPK